jgi:hypothetical protein
MFDRTPEERLLEVRQTLVAELERHKKAIESATVKFNKTTALLAMFDEGCRGLGMRAEVFAVTDALEGQFYVMPEDDAPEVDPDTGEVL